METTAHSLILNNIDEDVFTTLELHASLHGVTPEVEAKNLLKFSLSSKRIPHSREQHLARIRAIRDKNAHLQKTDSVDLLREDRDR